MNSWIKRTGAVAAAVLLLGGLFPLASLAAEEETDWVSEGYTPVSYTHLTLPTIRLV